MKMQTSQFLNGVAVSSVDCSRLPTNRVSSHSAIDSVDTGNESKRCEKYPEYREFENRLSSFQKHYRHFKKMNIYKMAETGLFATGNNDVTCCYACGSVLAYWEADDDPVVEHDRWYPACVLASSRPNIETTMAYQQQTIQTVRNEVAQQSNMPLDPSLYPEIQEFYQSLGITSGMIFLAAQKVCNGQANIANVDQLLKALNTLLKVQQN